MNHLYYGDNLKVLPRVLQRLFVVFSIMVSAVAITTKAIYAEIDCSSVKPENFQSVASKSEIEAAVSNIIQVYQTTEHRINWKHLSRCFENLGTNFTVEAFPGGGFDHGDVFRFTIDKTSILTPFTSIPGGSNDIFTAIINVAPSGKIGIVRRGGKLEPLE
ncbi:hypothetical protein [Cypionkella psychrotolerans]|uniref:hypothetical protein n=1 Tax=Cypionkella psychrotolerans TaxID=1678131 RepID=UPI0006B436E0|nr:hypothetical protein [Cypionkella psychrotolerans]